MVEDVPTHKWMTEEILPKGALWATRENERHPPYPPDNFCQMWDIFLFLSNNLDKQTISPATILAVLTKDKKAKCTLPTTSKFLNNSYFKLQVDGGANRPVTNNRNYLNTS